MQLKIFAVSREFVVFLNTFTEKIILHSSFSLGLHSFVLLNRLMCLLDMHLSFISAIKLFALVKISYSSVAAGAGFTHWQSKLKPRASEKMRGLITNNQDSFLLFTDIFSENKTSEDALTFFFLVFQSVRSNGLEPLIV